SLLPDYRGAARITRVLINGETETGVTTFFIDHDIDTGRILLRKKVLIGEKENAGMLHDRLMAEGAGLVVETIRGIASGTIEPVPQDALLKNGGTLRTAPKISREDCHIDWSRSGKEVFNLVRGLSPYPGSFAYLEGESGENLLFKFHETEFLPGGPGAEPGTISTDDRTFLRVAVEDGWMGILELQQEGKRVMPVGQFLRGFSFSSFYPRFS
ncbi:MAG: methionyl-tRNA formyltransferase, partial [Bacteroidales bacterium]|nr:methionyl-tRNA formyltransferase [Bacteroidales bacterium]